MRITRPLLLRAVNVIVCNPAWRAGRFTRTCPLWNVKLPAATVEPRRGIRTVPVPAADERNRTGTIQPPATREAVTGWGVRNDAAGRNAPQPLADRQVFQTSSWTLPAVSLSVSRNRYVPGRATLNGPTVTLPACGAKVNALTSLPFSDRRSSAEAERLV